MKLNADWHKGHVMLKNATHEERMEWHIEHTKHCGCRVPSESLQKQIDEYEKMKRL